MWSNVITAAFDHFAEMIEAQESLVKGAVQDALECPTYMESRYDSYRHEYSGRADKAVQSLNAMRATARFLGGLKKRGRAPQERSLLGAVVTLGYPDGSESYYLILPSCGGDEVYLDDKTVRLVSAESPIGQAVFGCSVGDVTYVQNGQDTEVVLIEVLEA